ncbi:hypothetical protein BHC49_13540 [Snodgrassella alvi]|uniref:Uncharacterized protein n=1 Tax=Snodgrassella alvi TaxID=1196083 RepID=A0A2N9XTA9_9NEIS|nr:hypothetical protein BHC49_13540 [Snodgrassella alvi]
MPIFVIIYLFMLTLYFIYVNIIFANIICEFARFLLLELINATVKFINAKQVCAGYGADLYD